VRKFHKYMSLVWVLIIYLLFFINDEENLGPEELEEYREQMEQWVQDNSVQLREEQEARRDTVREVCDRYGISKKQQNQPRQARELQLADDEWEYLKKVNWNYIYVSKPHSLLWCKVPKAGSSTWTYNFLKMAGHSTNSSKIHKLLRDYFPKQSRNTVLKDNYKFMVVRHPFERILSAYRDKLEDLSRDMEARGGYYYSMFGRHIVKEYRDTLNVNLTGVLEPTWKEFITYLIDTPVTKFDEHWTPMWMLCSPCIIRYNVIARMETFAEDTQFTLLEAGLDNQLKVEWKHRTGTGGSSDTIMDYYSQLTVSEVAMLFKKYQLDFELYGYNPESYLDIAIQSP